MPLNRSGPAASESRRRRRYFGIYTLAFWVTAFFVFLCFIQTNRSLIWSTDGWEQHYQALCYYAGWLRGILRGLLREHRLVIPSWEFHFGEGADVLNTLHYYVLGDPIALFSVFVPLRWMHYFYSFSCVLRMYLAGLSFSALAFTLGKRNRHAILAGALSYAFCGWCLLTAARHSFFLNPLILFPLLLTGLEQILQGKRPYCFILAAALSAACNFYFFYMIAILGVLYALIRLALRFGRDWRRGLALLLRLGGCALLGVCMAGVILLPVMLMFLSDSRASVDQPFHLFYGLSYYASLPKTLLNADFPHWFCGGFSAPVLLAFAALFLRKGQSRLLRILCCVCGLFLLFPIFGRILNGMGYMANRWSWVLPLLGAYVLVDQWDALLSPTRKLSGRLLIFCVLLYVCMIAVDQSRVLSSIALLPLLFLAVFIGRGELCRRPPLTPQRSMVLLTACSVILMGVWHYAPAFDNYLESCVANDQVVARQFSSEAHLAAQRMEGSYTRLSGRQLSRNANLAAGISSTQYYWTNSNAWLNRYRTELEVNETMYSMAEGYGDRTVPMTLSAVEFYSVPRKYASCLPYGFQCVKKRGETNTPLIHAALARLRKELGTEELSEDQIAVINGQLSNTVSLYQNLYTLPLGYCYGARIAPAVWDGAGALQRQQLQLDAVCLEDPKGGEIASRLPLCAAPTEDYKLPCEIVCLSAAVTPTEDGFVTTSKNAKVELRFRGLPNAETYLHATGCFFTATPRIALYGDDREADPLELYNRVNYTLLGPAARLAQRKDRFYWEPDFNLSVLVTASDGQKKTLSLLSADATFSSGRTDFLLCMGWREEPLTSLTLTLPEIGRYRFRELGVCAVPMDEYPDQIAALKEDCLESLRLGTDCVSGEITLKTPKALVLAIPYSKGWTALVDGREAPLLLANRRYLGLELNPGQHRIELRYSTPFLRHGAVVSAVGLSVFVLFILLYEARRRRKQS